VAERGGKNGELIAVLDPQAICKPPLPWRRLFLR
jgi:hypothetical protein